MNSVSDRQSRFKDSERELIEALVSSEAFRRLQEVSFLGAIDYYNLHKSKDSTWYFSRSDHVMGVLFLAQKLIEKIDFTEEDRLYVIASSICHDLGHSPFSHSTERAFKKINPNINHRVILEFVLSAPEMGVAEALSRFNLSRNRVLAITVGTDNHLGWIFHNPINIDTLDGMLRFMASFRLQPPFDILEAINSLAVLNRAEALSEEEMYNLDKFWEVKAAFYDQFLKRGVYARFEDAYIDLVISKKKNIGYRDYLKIDQELADEIGLYPDLYDRKVQNKPAARESNFNIDKSVPLASISDLHRRYLRKRGSA
ncbi:HD domain-containing protein [Mesorhizobium sp. M0045]|uniref:HD domain-containing protein n=1 Tax=Mesorhizobium sp. M0045 TaxID=2956857 RepID=UPI00333C42FC